MKIQFFAHAKPAASYDDGPNVIDGHVIELWRWDDMVSGGYALIGPVTVDIEFPEGWDPRAQQIEALKLRKAQLEREFSEAVAKINEQISKLSAIGYTPTPEAEPATVDADDFMPF